MSNDKTLNKQFLARLIQLLISQKNTSVKKQLRDSDLQKALELNAVFIAFLRPELPAEERLALHNIFIGIERLIYRKQGSGEAVDFSQAVVALQFLHSCIQE